MPNPISRRQAMAGLGGLAVLAVEGCATPLNFFNYYQTNAQGGRKADFKDEHFYSRIPVLDFGKSGKRILGQISPGEIVTDANGEPIEGDLLGIWTLKEGEYGYDIKTGAKRLDLRRADNTVRVYVKDPNIPQITTSRTYTERDVPTHKRVHVKSHPDFWVPAYNAKVNGEPTQLFYASYLEDDEAKLLFMPDCSRFFLNNDRVTYIGDVYREKLATLSSLQESINPNTIVTANLTLTNPATGNTIHTPESD